MSHLPFCRYVDSCFFAPQDVEQYQFFSVQSKIRRVHGALDEAAMLKINQPYGILKATNLHVDVTVGHSYAVSHSQTCTGRRVW